MLTDAKMQQTDRWQRGVAAASVILIGANILFAVCYVELSWLLDLWTFGVVVFVLGVWFLRPQLVIQVPLLLALFVWPIVMLASQRGQWGIMVMLVGLLLPVVIVFGAVWFAARLDRRAPPADD